MLDVSRFVSIEIPIAPDWEERVRGSQAVLGYFKYPEGVGLNGWYIDFDLDSLPRYFGPYGTAVEATEKAESLGMTVRVNPARLYIDERFEEDGT
jgi:hypothetical protein